MSQKFSTCLNLFLGLSLSIFPVGKVFKNFLLLPLPKFVTGWDGVLFLRKTGVHAPSSDPITLPFVSMSRVDVYTVPCVVLWLLADRLLCNFSEFLLSFWLDIFLKTSVFSSSNLLLSSSSAFPPTTSLWS